MFDEWDVISAYTRAQAIADGALVDLTDATDAGGRRLSPFRYPVAMTAAAFGRAVAAGGEWRRTAAGEEDLVLSGCQDFAGRVWDVLWLLVCAIRQAPAGDTVRFAVAVLTDGVRTRETVALKSVCVPGDHGEPVITIMLTEED
jgi:hypothetical protein